MVTGKLVRITPGTMEKLRKVARPFETPNDCIDRVLSARPFMKEDSEEESKK